MALVLALPLSFSPFAAMHGPDAAELVEQSRCAVRARIVERTDHETGAAAGVRARAEVGETLWGECPASFVFFYARSACGDRLEGEDLVIGLTQPDAAQRAYLDLAADDYLLAGALPASDALCVSLRVLRGAPGRDALLGLLDAGAHPDARVRRQAFRQLSRELAPHPEAEALAPLVPLAENEEDGELAAEYITLFGEARYAPAASFVTRRLRAAGDDAATEGAVRAFPKLATPRAVQELAAAYDDATLDVKVRILHAAAPCAAPEAHALLARALMVEETAVHALAAMRAAGLTLPAALPRVRDPVRAQRMRAVISAPPARPHAPRAAPAAPDR
ncbi:MAG TPA: hypothetical protein DCM87_14120 [Planctomycetes bacterium]|nr:hypothetical protein [Planctomycetota bacterium]